MKRWISMSCALSMIIAAPRARAERDEAATNASEADKPFTPKIVADVRFAGLFRANDGYFSQAHTFGYPVSSSAPGVEVTIGVEIVPRLTLAAGGGYFGSGATRRFARLMLTSESLELMARYAPLRWESDSLMVEVAAVLGGGRYWIRETYSDPSLFADTFTASDASMGAFGGVDASVHLAGVRFVLGYAYHYAPASIQNEIGGVARAGGHVIDVGFGARF